MVHLTCSERASALLVKEGWLQWEMLDSRSLNISLARSITSQLIFSTVVSCLIKVSIFNILRLVLNFQQKYAILLLRCASVELAEQSCGSPSASCGKAVILVWRGLAFDVNMLTVSVFGHVPLVCLSSAFTCIALLCLRILLRASKRNKGCWRCQDNRHS